MGAAGGWDGMDVLVDGIGHGRERKCLGVVLFGARGERAAPVSRRPLPPSWPPGILDSDVVPAVPGLVS